jgi:hypothetical protein
MSDGNFADYINRERDRLHAEREAVITQQRELDQRLAEINREFQAVDAYEAAKSGKAPARQSAPRGGGGMQRARRGSKREGILDAIKSAVGGLSRGELLQALGLKGDKSGEMSVSNALTALTKGNQVRRDGGKYHAA